jgi:hypothetical protein
LPRAAILKRLALAGFDEAAELIVVKGVDHLCQFRPKSGQVIPVEK